MTEKSNNISKHKAFSMIFLILVFAICLMLLPFDQLSFISGKAFADSNDMIDYSIGMEEQNDNITTDNNEVKTPLWQINVIPALDEKEDIQRNELKSLIEQINSIDLALPQMDYGQEGTNNSVPTDKTEKNVVQEKETQTNVKVNKSDNIFFEALTAETIQKLRNISEKPEEIDNPYEIGNTLYLSNNIGEAAAFYQEALRRSKPDDMSDSDDRAWLLFQTGNSLRSIDMLAAAEIYGKLITEYPNSPWAGYAKVQRNFITWYIADKPEELLHQNK